MLLHTKFSKLPTRIMYFQMKFITIYDQIKSNLSKNIIKIYGNEKSTRNHLSGDISLMGNDNPKQTLNLFVIALFLHYHLTWWVKLGIKELFGHAQLFTKANLFTIY